MGKPKFSSGPAKQTQILVGGRQSLSEVSQGKQHPQQPQLPPHSERSLLGAEDLRARDSPSALPPLPLERDPAGYVRHPAASHAQLLAAGKLQRERSEALFRNSGAGMLVSRSDRPPRRAHTSPSPERPRMSPDRAQHRVPPLIAPLKGLEPENEESTPSDVVALFQQNRDGYATTVTIVPDVASGSEFVVDTTLYQDQMVRMMRVREATSRNKLSKRSDVHQLACALDDTLRAIWNQPEKIAHGGCGASPKFERAREAIELAMSELTKQVSISCMDRGILLKEMFAQYAGLQDLSLTKMDSLEGQGAQLELTIDNKNNQIEAMKSDAKLFIREIHIFDDAIHAMVGDVIALQKEITLLDRRNIRQDQEYAALRRSHILTIEEIGGYKVKIELKEKARQAILMEKKNLEASTGEMQGEIDKLQATLRDEREMSKDAKEEMKIRTEEWKFAKESMEGEISELSNEILDWVEKEKAYQAEITALKKKVTKAEKLLQIERNKSAKSGGTPIARVLQAEVKEEVEEESTSDCESVVSDDGPVLVDIALLKETQAEVVQLQVNLVQTQEQVERGVMELERAIVAFEHSEFKVAKFQREACENEHLIAMLQMQIAKMEEIGQQMLGGATAAEDDADEVSLVQKEAEKLAQHAKNLAAEVAEEREAVEALMKAASTPQEKAEAAQKMNELLAKEKEAEKAKAAATEAHLTAKAKADNAAIMARERALQSAAQSRLSQAEAIAAEAFRKADEMAASATTDAERKAAAEALKDAERLQAEVVTQRKKLTDVHGKLAKDAKIRHQRAEKEATALRTAGMTAMDKAVTDEEKLAASYQMAASRRAQEEALLAEKRMQEVADALKSGSKGGLVDGHWQWRALMSMPLMRPGMSAQEMTETLNARMDLLGGLSAGEEKRIAAAAAQSQVSRVGFEASISAKDPTTGSSKFRSRLGAMQANCVTMLRATKAAGLGSDLRPDSGASMKSGEDTRKRLLYTPPAGSLTSSRPATRDPFAVGFMDGAQPDSQMMRELGSENESLKHRLGELQRVQQELEEAQGQCIFWQEESTRFKLEVERHEKAVKDRREMMLTQEIPDGADGWPEDAVSRYKEMRVEMRLLCDDLEASKDQLAKVSESVLNLRSELQEVKRTAAESAQTPKTTTSGKKAGVDLTDRITDQDQGKDATTPQGWKQRQEHLARQVQDLSHQVDTVIDGNKWVCVACGVSQEAPPQSRPASSAITVRLADPSAQRRSSVHDREPVETAAIQSKDGTDDSLKGMPAVKPNQGQTKAAAALMDQIKQKRKQQQKQGGTKGRSPSPKRGAPHTNPATNPQVVNPRSQTSAATLVTTRCSCILCLLDQFATQEPGVVAECLEKGIGECHRCGGVDKISDVVMQLLTRPLMKLGATLGGRAVVDAIEVTNRITEEAAEKPSHTAELRPSQHLPASSRQPLLRAKYPGMWKPHESVPNDEREPPQVPVFGKAGSVKTIHKTVQFCCICKDGHSTHCFFYVEREGLNSGGICQCMFSTDRVLTPATLEVKTEQQRTRNTEKLPHEIIPIGPISPNTTRRSVFHSVSPSAVSALSPNQPLSLPNTPGGTGIQ